MLGFLKSFSSNIHYNYSVQSRPSFTAGGWAVYDAKNKSTGDAVSVFVLEKKAVAETLTANGLKPRSAVLAEVWEFATRGVQELTKLRHPAVLKLVEPLEASKSSLTFVAERVMATVGTLSESDLDELSVVRGLTTVVQALQFLHSQLGVVHHNITRSTVFVDAQGDWKLGGFEFVATVDEHAAGSFFLPQLDPRMPWYMQPQYDYLAPELVVDKTALPANDVWNLASLIYTIYVRRPPLNTRSNPSAYKDELARFLRALPSAAPKLPASLQPYLNTLFCEDPNGRMALAALETTDFFQNPLIKALRNLDEYATKPVDDKVSFLKHFVTLLPQFPKQMRVRMVLRFATAELSGPRDPATAALVGNVLFAVAAELSRLTFQEQVLPLFVKLADYTQFQESVAANIAVVARDTSEKDFSKSVLPLIVDALKHHDAEHAPIQTELLSKADAYMDNVSIPKLDQTLFPAVVDCFAATPSRPVKIAATQCLAVAVRRGASKALLSDRLIPALQAMKTRNPSVVIAVAQLWDEVCLKLTPQQIFADAVPHLLDLSLAKELTVPQFKVLTDAARAQIAAVEKIQVKALAHNQERDEDDEWQPVTSLNTSTPSAAQPRSTPLAPPAAPMPAAPVLASIPAPALLPSPPHGSAVPVSPTLLPAAKPLKPPTKAANKPLPEPKVAKLPSPGLQPQPAAPAAAKPGSMASLMTLQPQNRTAPAPAGMQPLVPQNTARTNTPSSSVSTLVPQPRAQKPLDDEFGSFVSSSGAANGDNKRIAAPPASTPASTMAFDSLI